MIRVPEEYKYITEYETLKKIDDESLGFYYLVVFVGLSIEGHAGMRLTELYREACEKNLCEDRWGRQITYRAVFYDIRVCLKRAGLKESPLEYYNLIMKEYNQRLKDQIKELSTNK